MSTYIHPDGDTIETFANGKFVVTRGGKDQHFDVSHWDHDSDVHVENDIQSGYYEGFTKEES